LPPSGSDSRVMASRMGLLSECAAESPPNSMLIVSSGATKSSVSCAPTAMSWEPTMESGEMFSATTVPSTVTSQPRLQHFSWNIICRRYGVSASTAMSTVKGFPFADHRIPVCSEMRATSSLVLPNVDAAPHGSARCDDAIAKPSVESSCVKVASATVWPPHWVPMQTAYLKMPHMSRPSPMSPPVTAPKKAPETSMVGGGGGGATPPSVATMYRFATVASAATYHGSAM
jgi:hypothetical protein